ncbi:hypothetical protein X975_26535, partial [Stegodyphus mimosarum]
MFDNPKSKMSTLKSFATSLSSSTSYVSIFSVLFYVSILSFIFLLKLNKNNNNNFWIFANIF